VGIKLSFTGDVALRGSIGEKNDNPVSSELLKCLDSADLVLGNLETPLFSVKEISIAADPSKASVLSNIGFDILNLANNHILDCGEDAALSTTEILNQEGISYIGGGKTNRSTRKIVEINGLKIGFLGYTQSDGRLAPISIRGIAEILKAGLQNRGKTGFIDSGQRSDSFKIKKINKALEDEIKELQEDCDITVLSLHWGDQFAPLPSPDQVTIARNAIDSGADIVVGHHPHVAQPVERYKEGLIAYSLGDFLFDHPLSGEISLPSAVLEVEVGEEGVKNHEISGHNLDSAGNPSRKADIDHLEVKDISYLDFSDWIGRISYQYLKYNIRLRKKLFLEWEIPFRYLPLFLIYPFTIRCYFGLLSGKWRFSEKGKFK
jgi:poly-gamma-glutamate capsule biosynthesis protein CapA/YwtB (metallophosphatase superfamily)